MHHRKRFTILNQHQTLNELPRSKMCVFSFVYCSSITHRQIMSVAENARLHSRTMLHKLRNSQSSLVNCHQYGRTLNSCCQSNCDIQLLPVPQWHLSLHTDILHSVSKCTESVGCELAGSSASTMPSRACVHTLCRRRRRAE